MTIRGALKAVPGDGEALILRAHLYNRTRNCQAAESDANAAATKSVKMAGALTERGDARVCQEQYDAAIGDYTAAIAANTASAVLLVKRCSAYLSANQAEKALTDCDEALKKAPDSAYVFIQRAEVHLTLHHYEVALADANRALIQAPKDGEIFDIEGRANEGLGKLEVALASFDQAVRLDPARPVFYIHRARARRLAKNFDGARLDLVAAQSLMKPDRKMPAAVQAELESERSALAGNR